MGIVIEIALSQNETTTDPKAAKMKALTAGDSDDEVQKLIVVLRNAELGTPESKVDAIQRLGLIGDSRAVPILIAYIDFERKFEERQKSTKASVDHWDEPRSVATRFPAITALYQIGNASVPALIELIEDNPADMIKSQNALFTIHFIFRDDLSEAIYRLESGAKSQNNEEKRKRLLTAIRSSQVVKSVRKKNP